MLRSIWGVLSCILVICLLEHFVVYVLIKYNSPHSSTYSSRCIAHRGIPSKVVENSLSGYRLAAKMGALRFETDVHITADGELILMHDRTLDRTSNMTGRIVDLKWRDIESACLKGFDGTCSPVPTLSQFFMDMQRLNDTLEEVIIDVKSLDCVVIEKVAKWVNSLDTCLKNKMRIGIWNAECIATLTTIAEEGSTIMIGNDITYLNSIESAPTTMIVLITEVVRDPFWAAFRKIYHKNRIYVFTLNGISTLLALLSNVADGIVTDEVDKCIYWEKWLRDWHLI